MHIQNNYTHGGDIYTNHVTLDFSANVNPLGTPEPVLQAARAAVDRIAIYPDPYCTGLRELLSRQWKVDQESILCGNGAAELLFQFALALRPQKILLPVPSFSEYEAALRAAGSRPTLLSLKREAGFALKRDILDEITGETDLVVLCTPNNPTGAVIDWTLLMEILEKCRETGTWLLLDECFLGLTDDGCTRSIIPELREGDPVFVLRAFTKLYGMAGARLGYAICRNHGFLEKLCTLSQPWNVSTVAQAAGEAALTACGDFVAETRRLIREEKEYLEGELRRLGVGFLPGKANFLMLTGMPGLYEKMLERGILIRRCSTYPGLTEGDFRIAVRTHRENMALLAALEEIQYG